MTQCRVCSSCTAGGVQRGDCSVALFSAFRLIIRILAGGKAVGFTAESLAGDVAGGVGSFARTSPFLQQPIFNSYHNEHDMLR
jgi:hypothetical protein